jgi:hypothetical protein
MKASFLILLLLIGSHASSQMLTDWETSAENFYKRIKNIEFFIDRFNHQPEGSGHVTEVSKKDTVTYLTWLKERDGTILTLFDKQRLKKEGDSYIKKGDLRDFILQVNNPHQQQFLHFSDSAWYATFTLEAIYQKKEVAIECVLVVNRTQEGAYTWAMTSMYSKELTLDEHFNNQLNFIPSVHGTDFIGVRLALSDPAWIAQIRAGDKPIPSHFLDLLASKELQLTQIRQITYHFLQIKDWVFSVQYVNRESSNAGWLVDRLIPLLEKGKINYLIEKRIN